MITVEVQKVGKRVIATVKVGIGTGQFTYTVQFADQGSETANKAEAQRELRKTLEEVLGALGIVKRGHSQQLPAETASRNKRAW
jgi:hypothetical protein